MSLKNFIISEQHRKILEDGIHKRIEKKKKKFFKRKNNHYNNEKLKKVFDSIEVKFSDVLYDIPFTCYFSFYLFLILKNRLRFISWDKKPAYFKIGICQDINILELNRQTGICRNSIRDAYRELVKYKLIEESNLVEPYHKSTRTCLVYNDFLINCFEEELGHVIYNSQIPNDHSTYDFLQKKYGSVDNPKINQSELRETAEPLEIVELPGAPESPNPTQQLI